MVALERGREFDLIAYVLPLFRHIGTLKVIRFYGSPLNENPAGIAFAS